MSQILNKIAKSVYTWNGALSFSTTGFNHYGACLDYWTKAGTYGHRPQALVDQDMVRTFTDDQRVALAIVFALRLISRKPDVEGIEDTQTGYGRKDEFYKALIWLHQNKPQLLYLNLHLIPVFGCWKDLITEPLIDVLDREKVYQLVRENLGDSLLRKYLPQIRSRNKLRSERDRKRVEWAKGLCQSLGISFPEYRKLKAEGTAHIWQQQMSQKKFSDINFNGIPGKAMLWHVSRKGKDGLSVFERQGQVDRLKSWLLQQKQVKFTGYPYELTRAASCRNHPSLLQKIIYNQQFATVIEPLANHQLGNVLCALDTSGSMRAKVAPDVSAYDIALSMGLIFSSLNVGEFKDVVVAFDSVSKLVPLKGEFVDRLHQLETMATAWGSTNFQSVIDLLVRVREENPEIPLQDYPATLLVISDMQFNPVGENVQTNYEAAMEKLTQVGLGRMRIIWWLVNGAVTDFPAQMDDEGVYMIGGFDSANLKALLGLDGAHNTSLEQDGITNHSLEVARPSELKPANLQSDLIWSPLKGELWQKLEHDYEIDYESFVEGKDGSQNRISPLHGMMNFFNQPIFSLLQFESLEQQ